MKFELRLIEPNKLKIGKQLAPIMDIGDKVETDMVPPAMTSLIMSAMTECDSSYRRYLGFDYPVRIWVNQLLRTQSETTRVQTHSILFWQREEDSLCLVSFDNISPEENFKGEYVAAIDWVCTKLKRRLGF